MTERTHNSRAEPSLDEVAAHWLLRRQDGLDARERRTLAEWLRDPAHAAVFAELDRTSELLDGLRTAPGSNALPRTGRRVSWLAVGLAAAAALTAVMNLPRRPPAAAPDSYVQGVATDVGEFRNVLLPDGSVVGLNTNSVVEIVYSAAERRIRLTRGEAFFTVAKNPNRPFWVEADGVSVRAVGTAFDVRDRPDAIEVLVREGKVQVHRAGSAQPAALLVAGEKAVVSRAATSAAARVSVAAMKLVAGEPVRRFLAATDRPSAGNMVARDDGGRERKP